MRCRPWRDDLWGRWHWHHKWGEWEGAGPPALMAKGVFLIDKRKCRKCGKAQYR